MTTLRIRPVTPHDAAAICAIYNPYIVDSCISFEETALGTGEMALRIARQQEHGLPWLVAELDGAISGYAYASPWRVRAAYRHAVESSVYLPPVATGRGIGRQLYQALVAELRARGLHTVIAGVAQPNAASDALHRSLGFKQVACFEQVGRKFGRWLDVAYWQLQLDADSEETACN